MKQRTVRSNAITTGPLPMTHSHSPLSTMTIAVLGLGYVGLPLAVEFGKKTATIGFDISEGKIRLIRDGIDPTGELADGALAESKHLVVTSETEQLRKADFMIVAVPTPVLKTNIPDFAPLISASHIVGQNLKQGATIVFESTVYPGATEEICIPVIEKASGLTWKTDFFIGYSPVRINPGDKERTLTKITKVVAGDTLETAERLEMVYGSIISAGTYRAPSIQVAEAAKVIENTQRDLNIALINELALIFDRLNIDTLDVLKAAGTKWNFLPFRPGLVGGHCIGVDPYYLTHKAESIGHHPKVILAGRHINDNMATFVAQRTIKELIANGTNIKGAKVVVMGLTFKENCSDLRNSKVAELIQELTEHGCLVSTYDPLANPIEALREYDIVLQSRTELPHNADAVVLAVPHNEIIKMSTDQLLSPLKKGGVVVDLKSALCKTEIVNRGYRLWRL